MLFGWAQDIESSVEQLIFQGFINDSLTLGKLIQEKTGEKRSTFLYVVFSALCALGKN